MYLLLWSQGHHKSHFDFDVLLRRRSGPSVRTGYDSMELIEPKKEAVTPDESWVPIREPSCTLRVTRY